MFGFSSNNNKSWPNVRPSSQKKKQKTTLVKMRLTLTLLTSLTWMHFVCTLRCCCLSGLLVSSSSGCGRIISSGIYTDTVKPCCHRETHRFTPVWSIFTFNINYPLLSSDVTTLLLIRLQLFHVTSLVIPLKQRIGLT